MDGGGERSQFIFKEIINNEQSKVLFPSSLPTPPPGPSPPMLKYPFDEIPCGDEPITQAYYVGMSKQEIYAHS